VALASRTTRVRGDTIKITVPDQIAILRILLIPVVMALIVLEGEFEYADVIALVVFTIAAGSDFLDGYLARRWHVTSTLGAFLDTVADKLLITGVLFALVEVGRAWAWAAWVIVGREIAVMGLRGLAALEQVKVPPSWWGKWKATVQFIAIGLAIIRIGDPLGPWYLDQWAMLVAVAITIISGVEYFVSYGRVLASK